LQGSRQEGRPIMEPARNPLPLPARLGPRPLPLHLAIAFNSWLSSQAALPLLRNGSIDWRPEVASRAAALSRHLAAAERRPAKAAKSAAPGSRQSADAAPHDDPFARAVAGEVCARLHALAAGITAYRHHPYRRALADPPVLWRNGTTRLLDFGPPGGRPVLFVPSLINRTYILDLSRQHSLLRWLAHTGGLRPLLVDWDAPGAAERAFTLTDYIADRLDGAFVAAHQTSPGGAPIAVVGYCMGGLLALALALRRHAQVARLALLATPWDFHAERPDLAVALGRTVAAAEPLLADYGELPVDAIQAMFTTLDPFLVLRKFIAFAQLDPASDKAETFVALEDWLNDGVALAGPVAHECLAGWYGDNTPQRRQWRVGSDIVDPARLAVPALVLVPEQDRIVPPRSALALGDALPAADVRTVPFGHIGMVAGARAPAAIWQPLADWLAAP